MTIEEIKARKAEISEELKSADITEDRISALENEVSSLEAEERKELQEVVKEAQRLSKRQNQTREAT